MPEPRQPPPSWLLPSLPHQPHPDRFPGNSWQPGSVHVPIPPLGGSTTHTVHSWPPEGDSAQWWQAVSPIPYEGTEFDPDTGLVSHRQGLEFEEDSITGHQDSGKNLIILDMSSFVSVNSGVTVFGNTNIKEAVWQIMLLVTPVWKYMRGCYWTFNHRATARVY